MTRKSQDLPHKAVDKPQPPPNIPAFSVTRILTDRSTSSVRSTASYLSLDFALLGHVSVAAEIQRLLHDRNYIPEKMYDGAGNYWPALNFAYEAAKITGPSMDDEEALEKRQETEIASIEKECFRNSPKWTDPGKDRRQRETEERLRKVFDDGVYNVPEEEAIQALVSYADISGIGSFQARAARARLIDLLAEKGRTDQARDVLDQCIQAFHESTSQQLCSWLPTTRNAWKILVDQTVAVKLGLKEEDLVKKGKEAVRVIEQRLRDGPNRRPLEDKTEAELIDIIEANVPTLESFRPSDEELSRQPKTGGRQRQWAPKWQDNLRKPGASEQEISAVEEKLEISLPDDFKAFLRVTNGFGEHARPNEIDVINGTSKLQFGPPLIPDFTLDLLPHAEAFRMPDVKQTLLDRVIELNPLGIERAYVYLVEPRLIDEARVELLRYYDDEAEDWMKRNLDMAIDNNFGGKDEFAKMGWGVMIFGGGGTNWEFKPSFRVYLEDLASRCQELDADEDR